MVEVPWAELYEVLWDSCWDWNGPDPSRSARCAGLASSVAMAALAGLWGEDCREGHRDVDVRCLVDTVLLLTIAVVPNRPPLVGTRRKIQWQTSRLDSAGRNRECEDQDREAQVWSGVEDGLGHLR